MGFPWDFPRLRPRKIPWKTHAIPRSDEKSTTMCLFVKCLIYVCMLGQFCHPELFVIIQEVLLGEAPPANN
jgi:hypothetical protein